MSVAKKIKRWLGIRSRREREVPKVDCLANLRSAINVPFGMEFGARQDVSRSSINWVVPEVGIGGGGHLNIFRMVANLEQLGFECRIIIDAESRFPDGAAAKQFITDNYLRFNAPVFIGQHSMPPAWFTFASAWETAYIVRNFRGTRHKCYFVQDFEPLFFAAGSASALAEQTYRFGLYGVTAGDWLAEKLARDYGMRTTSVGFSYDKGRYQCLPREGSRAVKRVFFYGRPATPRRGFELGIMVLADVVRRLPDVEVVVAGCDASAYLLPFKFVNAGMMALDDLPRLYNDCDAALVLSFTNLSLLPLELMACGCPVISNTGPNVEWLLNDSVAMLAEPTVVALSNALVDVLQDTALRRRLIESGLTLANSTDWGAHAQTLAYALRTLDGSLSVADK